MASLLLPRRTAVPATALYAFCRVADDLIDDAASSDASVAVLALRERLDAVYAGRPGNVPEDRALAEVVSHFGIPRSMPEALLEGLAWDASGREYHTLSSLYDYAARVAGCVGAMMALVMGTTDARAVARACDLGVAMQLTNIARDVGEDARMGRLYLPRDWFVEAGIDADGWLAAPNDDVRVRAMTRRLLGYADVLYRRSDAGVALLPIACRPGIRAARLIYADIGREIARAGYRTLDQAGRGPEGAQDGAARQGPPERPAGPSRSLRGRAVLAAAVGDALPPERHRVGALPGAGGLAARPVRDARAAGTSARLSRASAALALDGLGLHLRADVARDEQPPLHFPANRLDRPHTASACPPKAR